MHLYTGSHMMQSMATNTMQNHVQGDDRLCGDSWWPTRQSVENADGHIF